MTAKEREMSDNIYTALAKAHGIDRFPDYRFTEDGQVITLLGRRPRFLKPIRMGGYCGLVLKTASGGKEKQYLHRLICEAFHGPCPPKSQCRHLDGQKINNSASNLRWGTVSENEKDKNEHGIALLGLRNPMAKLSAAKVRRMREIREADGSSYAEIASRFSVSPMAAYRAINKQTWSHV